MTKELLQQPAEPSEMVSKRTGTKVGCINHDCDVCQALDLGYNVGVGAVCKSSINAKVQSENYAAACATITQFRFAAGKDCSIRSNNCFGVWRRRQWAQAMCNGELTQDQIAKGYAGYMEAVGK